MGKVNLKSLKGIEGVSDPKDTQWQRGVLWFKSHSKA